MKKQSRNMSAQEPDFVENNRPISRCVLSLIIFLNNIFTMNLFPGK